ncbi:amidase [Nocardiopsis suaedae]|uniref:Amidase n=1 Tax=Nocardiopsis suaedae TaxID=3018444 RepID=A0ABT4TQJ6_9ACTN|nr:amidase [Nocardiopsis suaedae]MDA2806412.1 amidase [Nocardiopsis suaedae]
MTTRQEGEAVDRDAPADLTAADLLEGYARGGPTPVEALESVLARIEREDAALNAFCAVFTDEAREQARASAERWARGAPAGPLDGVPVAVKDVHLMRGHPTRRGSHVAGAHAPFDDESPVVARLREAGAVFTGKTTTPEIAWKGVTDSPVTGITRNPWDLSCTPGGSSGGAAAAVASGMGPMATGTDGGGSVRIPASFTGVYALKPTWGRVPHYPASAFGSLAHTGPITRTVTDAALMMDVMSRPDARDWGAMPPPAESFAVAVAAADVRGLRVAYSPALWGIDVDPEVARLCERAAGVFEGLGAHVELEDPPVPDCREEFHVLWYSGAAKAMEGVAEEDLGRVDPGLLEIVEEGHRYSAVDYLRATAVRMSMGEAMGLFHERYDLLLSPAMPIPAFEAGREVPPGSADPRWTSWAGFSSPFNMTSQPAASVPCGLTDGGLPVGLQIVGARHADGRVLAASRAYEEASPWPSLVG